MPSTYSATRDTIRESLPHASSPHAALQAAMALIHDRHPKYEWVGIYILRGDTLHLGPYVGKPTEHTRIPVGKGVCGAAVATAANQLIEDVRALDNYIACSASVRSEIVVLIRDGADIIAQIDADSDQVAAFTTDDESFLGSLAPLLTPFIQALP
jgi:L-methionine (R)-S-oxide reductase